MMKVGFIGTGTMGLGMAMNLLENGYSLTVWNRTRERAQPLIERGATFASSLKEVASNSDVIITMLSADQQVKEILIGENGVTENGRSKQIIIDSSTVSPETSCELFNHFKEKEIEFLDAPVTGSAPQANEGTLSFIVGGDKSTYDKVKDLFNAMGKSSVYMGETGSGSTAKLISNVMVSISLLSLSEGIAMAEKSNLNLNRFLEIVAAGGANSRMVEMKADKLVEDDYSNQFASILMNKDLGLAYRLAEKLKLTTPTLGLAKQIFNTSVNKGYGEEDVSSIYKLYKEWGNI